MREDTKTQKRKSGDSASEGSQSTVDSLQIEERNKRKLEHWEFYDCTQFLRDSQLKRK